MAKRVCRDCPIPNCGAKYLVKLSNHLADVHELDYINRRKWLQEAKLQPKVRVMIYPAKGSQGLRGSRSETPLPPHPISFTFSLPVLKTTFHSPFSLLTKLLLFKPKKMSWSDNYNDYLLQRGNGNFEDSEESEDSQSSQETDSSHEATEHVNPWSRILDEAQERHEVQLNALVDEYERNGEKCGSP